MNFFFFFFLIFVFVFNVQQQANQHQEGGGVNSNDQHHYPHQNPHLPPPPPPPPPQAGVGIRPGSMAERARLAKIPQPEAALKCPRCESTNTKFCYFNNYSLTQPRHFCKTCRRYWTRGGALRNVPVGGGCRRNKRSKGSSGNSSNSNCNSSSRSKSPAAIADLAGAGQVHAGPSTSSSGAAMASNSDIISRMTSQLPILPPLHHLGSYNSTDIGLNFGGIQASMAAGGGDMEFHGGSNGLVEQWRLNQVQQFPFLTGLEPSPTTGLYSFDHGDHNQQAGVEQSSFVAQLRSSSKPVLEMISSGVTTTHLAAVKMEENDREKGLNLSRNFLGNISGNNNNDHNQYWAGGSSTTAWTDLTGFASSNSTTHLL